MNSPTILKPSTESGKQARSRYLYVALVCFLNLYLAAVAGHIYGKPGYSPFHPFLQFFVWALGLSIASSLLVLFYRFRFQWCARFNLVATLDLTTSLLCLVLLRCLRLPAPEQRLHAVGYAYALLILSKLAVLTLYGCANFEGRHDLRNRYYLFVMAMAVYFAICPWTRFASWPMGDEPHYLLLSYSLVHDHDFDVTNNYAQKDYWTFYPVPLEQHTVKSKAGAAMLWHDPGISILLVPGFWAGERLGAMLEMSLFGASVALAIYMLARFLGAPPAASLLTTVLFCFTAPMVVYASQTFPEVIGAALCLWALVAFSFYLRSEAPQPLLVAGTLLGLMPWVCIRYWAMVGPLFLVIAARVVYVRKTSPTSCIRDLLALGLPALCLLLAFSIFDLHYYGTPLPNESNLAVVGKTVNFVPQPLVGGFGTLLDRAFGLLPVTPLYILVIAGMFQLLRSRRHLWLLAAMLLPALAYFGLLSVFENWNGAWCPQGRYILSAALPCVPVAASLLQNARHRLLLVLLALWSLGSAIIFTALPLLRYPSIPDVTIGGLNRYIGERTGIAIWRAFPSMVLPRSHEWLLVVVWSALTAVCVWLMTREKRAVGTTQGPDRRPLSPREWIAPSS